MAITMVCIQQPTCLTLNIYLSISLYLAFKYFLQMKLKWSASWRYPKLHYCVYKYHNWKHRSVFCAFLWKLLRKIGPFEKYTCGLGLLILLYRANTFMEFFIWKSLPWLDTKRILIWYIFGKEDFLYTSSVLVVYSFLHYGYHMLTFCLIYKVVPL